MKEEKIFCFTPTCLPYEPMLYLTFSRQDPNKKPIRIDRWKYDLLRKTILKIVPKNGEGSSASSLTM